MCSVNGGKGSKLAAYLGKFWHIEDVLIYRFSGRSDLVLDSLGTPLCVTSHLLEHYLKIKIKN